MRRKIVSNIAYLPIVFLSVFYILKAVHFPVHDFANYYFGGEFLAEGKFNSSIYFPYEFNKNIADLAYSGIFVSYAPNTPFLALLFLPFSFLPLATAKLIFNCIGFALFLYSLRRLIRFYKIKPIYLVILPLLFLVPIKNNLLFGQVYFVLFFLLAESVLAYERKQFTKTGFFLSLAILLKVFPALIILIFVFRKEVRPLLTTFVFCLLLFGISIVTTGFDVWLFYAKLVLSKASNGEIAMAYVDNYQSVFMFLKRILVWNQHENPTALFHHPILFKTLILAFKIALISMGYFICKKVPNALYVFTYMIVASILISPYGSTYIFILLIFAYLYGMKTVTSTAKKTLFMGLLFLISNMPLNGFLTNCFPFSYLRLLFLMLLSAFVLSQHLKTISWKWVLIITLIPCVAFAFFTKKETIVSQPFLGEITPILMYDYEFSENELIYYYWNEKGENKQSMRFAPVTVNPIIIKHNQLFYNNKQLTFDNSNKLKPLIINDKMVLYLSDYERGIGFYSLQMIMIEKK